MPDENLLPLLKGKQVLVTRAQRQSAAMCSRIRAYGGEAVPIPLIDYLPAPFTAEERENWLESVQQADWVILTSRNSLDYFMRLLDRPERMRGVRLAVVGRKTGERLRAYGLHADFIPETYTVQGLLDAFCKRRLKARQIAVPLGSLSDKSWIDKLKCLGIRVTSHVIYQTVANTPSQPRLVKIIESGSLSAITFASPSAVRFFTELLPENSWRGALKRCTIAVIGPSTAKAIEGIGYSPDVIPSRFTAADMIDSLAIYYSNKKGSHCNEQQS